ncbi:TRAP transporter substrate-binding protein [Marasmitruncus massiliensis]|uniref:TRAP transporter substrate-binding protein n=1 Tax=Marasmitruncus massiliensis TaxID=1944642 RepID=UPI000C7C2EB9|nr:TRAP transporter substrate-binding protein [Marasmitruncus massiliensis]
MKKVLSAMLVTAMFTSVLSGCGGASPAATSSTTPPVVAPASSESASADEVFEFKLAENQPADNPISKGMQKFAELAKEKSGGTVNIEVYLDAQLGSENETIDQIQAGTLDFARINTSALSSTADEVGVFTLPYIFTSTEHKYKVLDGKIGQGVIDSLEKYNMIGLGYWESGSRSFYSTKKPIKGVADMKGLKVRVQQSDVAIKMVELLGAAATPMSYGEVYQGLQTGVIDAAENDFVSYYTSGHYEVAKNYTLDGHMAPPAMVLMSKTAWDKLSDNQKAAVTEAALEACTWQRQAMNDYQEEARKKVEEAGCEVFDVDVKEFQNSVSAIYDMYPQYADIIAAIKNVA